MNEAPRMAFAHMGIYVIDIAKMADFYTRVLGFAITDRGPSTSRTPKATVSSCSSRRRGTSRRPRPCDDRSASRPSVCGASSQPRVVCPKGEVLPEKGRILDPDSKGIASIGLPKSLGTSRGLKVAFQSLCIRHGSTWGPLLGTL